MPVGRTSATRRPIRPIPALLSLVPATGGPAFNLRPTDTLGGRHGVRSAHRQRTRHRGRGARETASPTQRGACGVRRYFTIPGRDPFDEIEWELRDAFIPGKDGPVFEQKGVEFPKFWSQTATNIVAQKYFRGRMSSPERESSVKQMIGRVVDTIGGWGREGGYFEDDEEAETFEAELKAILVNQLASFNSPVWFNVGFEERPQARRASSSRSKTRWSRSSTGSGARGSSSAAAPARASTSRTCAPRRSSSRRAATPPGPVSFMRGADASAGTIKSGGKTRRAAKMVVLDIDHPDVEEFIWCKAHEEEKARVLEAAGYDMSLDSPDWASIQYQNANNSVRVTDAFMEAAEANDDWNLTARTDGSVVTTVPARDLLAQAAEAAWRCADPGVQYDTTINAWHTLPNTGRINASNPCSEYMSIDDSACNLASINLMKFRREDGELDVEAFEHAVDTVFLAQEILVGYSSYPTPEIDRNAKAYRQLGLGYANLGALLMSRGLPYDSDEGRAYAAAITALMTGRAYRKSAEIAARMGPFAGYQPNAGAMLGVIAKHRAAVGNIEHRPRRARRPPLRRPPRVGRRARPRRGRRLPERAGHRARADGDDQLHDGLRHDRGRAGLLAREDEEARRRRRDHDREQDRPDGARQLGYAPEERDQVVAFIDDRNTVVGAPFLKTEHYPVFDCAIGERAIHYMGHVKMMGAVQPFISGAISKTVNLPEETTVEEISQLFVDAWKLGVKAIAIYRDNCKVAQPLSKKADAAAPAPVPKRGPAPPPRRPHRDRPQVPRRRLRGLHPRRPLRRRHPRRHLRRHRQGGHDPRRPHELVHDLGLARPPVRRPARGLRLEVRAHALRAERPDERRGHPRRQVARRLHLPLDGQEVPRHGHPAGARHPEPRGAQAPGGGPRHPGERRPQRDAEAAPAPPPGQTALFNALEDAVECAKCGGRMVRTGSCYTCRDCGQNTGCS